MTNRESKPEHIYSVYSAFPIPTANNGLPVKRLDQKFWSDVEKSRNGLSEAIGCYIFGIKTAGGGRIIPWYVGMTIRSFKIECNEKDKVNKYNEVLTRYKKGGPRLFLIPRMTLGGRFSYSCRQGDIEFLEQYLIAVALDANPRLINVRGTKMYEKLYVPGVLNPKPGKSNDAVNSLKDCLSLC